MTQPMAADDVCEHHYETRIRGGRPISVPACVFCRTPDWADLDEQAVELYRWGWQEGRDGKAAREKLSAYDKPQLAATEAPEPATITDPEWLRQQYAAAMLRVVEPFREIVRPEVFRIVDELATAVLNVRDRHLAQLRQRLELADADLGDRAAAGAQARTTPDNGAASGDTADNPLRADANAWRHKAIRRALTISKLRGTIDAVTDLAHEEITARTEWGDGYRAAIADLREVLREFGQIDQTQEQP
ncbi:hypothetical protein ACFRFU_19515 [Streptomyces sp. NPDC056704]|uniref:hypothetical protein n=1 Tax=Streptomyces sp. NPDC056704 TaxID=3345917 RepID=UPI00367AD438